LNDVKNGKLTLLTLAAAVIFFAAPARAERISASHITALEGSASLISEANGRTEAEVNLPLVAGDQVVTHAGARVEIELADGNRIQIAGETQVRLGTLAGEEGSEATESTVVLVEGTLAAESVASDENRALRIDTPEASIYLPHQAQVRINLEPHRGTAVIVRQGSADVKMPAGSRTVEAGSYLLVNDGQEPEVAQGTFSRDRFDVWVADRTQTMLQAYNSTSSRYVDRDYSGDVSDLDNYGSWDYSETYGGNVWRPTVADGWSPYSDGSWYYTPAGASWVSYEPWGWFPYHYGNWFFDAGFGSWCWTPAYIYAPAWVYWCYAPSYVGWCPIGYYSFYGPYWGSWGWHSLRSAGYVAVTGVFNPVHVDFHRGWNFVKLPSFGGRLDRGSVLPGSAVAARLGKSVAITSQPVRTTVSGRGISGGEALRSFAQSAPQKIGSESLPTRSAILEPYLGRQKTLPPATVMALRDAHVTRVDAPSRSLEGPGSGRLPGAGNRADLAPRPAPLSGGLGSTVSLPREETWRGGPARKTNPAPGRSFSSSPQPRANSGPAWRSYSRTPVAPPPTPKTRQETADSWRVRPGTPPAQRVIDGVDRGRAVPLPRAERTFEQPRRAEPAPRAEPRYTPQPRSEPRSAPAPHAREFSAPHSSPPPASHGSPPPPRSPR
jgi:hypothetical protein